MAEFSFVIPTRNRPEQLTRFLESVLANTRHPESLEIILGIDDDDVLSPKVEMPGLTLKHAIIKPGLTMAAINDACYRKVTGRYVMLLNDDIILRTPDWDVYVRELLEEYPDEIVLIHVNDKLFEDRLCCFPLLTRTYLELMGGVSPLEYRRYRIDDHIFNIFSMLALLGERRIVYTPDIVFEHHNYEIEDGEKKVYTANVEYEKLDEGTYRAYQPQRKAQVLALYRHIQAHRAKKRLEACEKKLATLTRPLAGQRLEALKVRRLGPQAPTTSTERITIGVICGNEASTRLPACLEAIRSHTAREHDLLIIDKTPNLLLDQAREINRMLEIRRSERVVLMSDEIQVRAGWLEGLESCLSDQVAMVAPVEQSPEGYVLSSGLFPSLEEANYDQITDAPLDPSHIVAPAGNLVLLDMAKLSSLIFPEQYRRYFLWLVAGLQAWEMGFDVIATPEVSVVRSRDETLLKRIKGTIFPPDARTYTQEWIETQRLQGVLNIIAARSSSLRAMLSMYVDPHGTLASRPGESFGEYRARVERLFPRFNAMPSYVPRLKQWLETHLNEYSATHSRETRDFLRRITKSYEGIESLEFKLETHDIYMMGGQYVAVPEALGPLEPALLGSEAAEQLVAARSFAELELRMKQLKANTAS